MLKHADISDCGRYRYWLERAWGNGALLTFVMLNPSTADRDVDDPTIRRCMGFARRENLDGIKVVNLFAWRTPYPGLLKATIDPVGPQNNGHLIEALCTGGPVVAAWGANDVGGRDVWLKERAAMVGTKLMCFGRTANGSPRHPLYVPGDQPLEVL